MEPKEVLEKLEKTFIERYSHNRIQAQPPSEPGVFPGIPDDEAAKRFLDSLGQTSDPKPQVPVSPQGGLSPSERKKMEAFVRNPESEQDFPAPDITSENHQTQEQPSEEDTEPDIDTKPDVETPVYETRRPLIRQRLNTGAADTSRVKATEPQAEQYPQVTHVEEFIKDHERSELLTRINIGMPSQVNVLNEIYLHKRTHEIQQVITDLGVSATTYPERVAGSKTIQAALPAIIEPMIALMAADIDGLYEESGIPAKPFVRQQPRVNLLGRQFDKKQREAEAQYYASKRYQEVLPHDDASIRAIIELYETKVKPLRNENEINIAGTQIARIEQFLQKRAEVRKNETANEA